MRSILSYPAVKHKIPELFSLIIENDRQMAELKASDVIQMDLYKGLKSERTNFRRGAEAFIIKQKGGKA
jgi:hypothetical protein